MWHSSRLSTMMCEESAYMESLAEEPMRSDNALHRTRGEDLTRGGDS